jgi:MFS family permease
LIHWGLNLYQIGLLSSVIYGIAYLVEIPAGALADAWGLKTVLLTAFVVYIVSFFFYAAAGEVQVQKYRIVSLVFASVFYGLGEAFRSGVHKAMIMRFLVRVLLFLPLQY